MDFPGETDGYLMVEVRARVEGILLEQLFTEGKRVFQGEPLFKIDPRPFEAEIQKAQANLAEAEASFETASKTFQRMKKLLPTKAISQKDFDDAEGNFLSAAAAIKSAHADITHVKLSLEYTDVLAPISGITSDSYLSEGSLVSPQGNSLLSKIVQLDPIQVNFGISDKEWEAFKKQNNGTPLSSEAKVFISLTDDSLYHYVGRLIFLIR